MPDSQIANYVCQTDLAVIEDETSPYGHCQNNTKDLERYYNSRRNDYFDLSIENAARNGCTVCYGVGKHLWPLAENELLKTLTRSDSDEEDCEPKPGYHKSKLFEIYRCEEGDDVTGVMAYTEANGETDYKCGYYSHEFGDGGQWWEFIKPERKILDFGQTRYLDQNPVKMVSFGKMRNKPNTTCYFKITRLNSGIFRIFFNSAKEILI